MTDFLYTVEALGMSGVTNQPHLVWNGSEAVPPTETDACFTNNEQATEERNKAEAKYPQHSFSKFKHRFKG